LRIPVTINLLLLLGLFCLPALAQEPAAGPTLFGEKPDSAYITLLRSLKHNRFEVRLTDGSEFKGRATVTDSGLVLTGYTWRTTSQREEKTRFVRWKEIQSLRALKKDSIVPPVIAVSAMGFLGFILLICSLYMGD